MKRVIKKRIICIGNRFIEADTAGPLVFDHLKEQTLPSDTEIIDGGMAGLNLLGFLENVSLVVFVDSITGFVFKDSIAILGVDEIIRNIGEKFSHDAGLGYLLKVLPDVLESKIPEIRLVGIEGRPQPQLIKQAAEISLTLTL